MNSVFKSSQSTSEIQEEILPTFWVPQAKASKMTKLTKYQITKHVVSWLLRNECPAVVTTTSSCYRFDLLRFLFFFLFSSAFSLLSVAVARHFLMRGKLFFYSKRFYFFFYFFIILYIMSLTSCSVIFSQTFQAYCGNLGTRTRPSRDLPIFWQETIHIKKHWLNSPHQADNHVHVHLKIPFTWSNVVNLKAPQKHQWNTSDRLNES